MSHTLSFSLRRLARVALVLPMVVWAIWASSHPAHASDKPAIDVRLRPLVAEWKLGEDPRLSLRFVNEGLRSFRVPRCPTLLEVKVDGKPLRLRGPSTLPYVAKLRPGRPPGALDFGLDGFYREETPGKPPGPFQRFRLEEGKHTVRVAVWVDDLETGETIRLESNPVEVKLRPAQAAATGGNPSDREGSTRRRMAAARRVPKPRLGVYLVTDPTRIQSIEEASVEDLDLSSVPFLTEKDIIRYDASTHALELTPAAKRRLPSPGVWGIPFVVVADGERLYCAAFWTHLSSYMPKLPMCFPRTLGSVVGTETGKNEIRIGPPPFGDLEDPRGDPRLLKVLRALGRLSEPVEEPEDP